MSDNEKTAAEAAPVHAERTQSPPPKPGEEHEAIGGATFAVDESELPPGYFKSSFFLGSMLAIGLGLVAGVGGFAFAAPVLSQINDDIGPSANINWVALVYSLTSSVTLTIIGRVTDILGRRWVFTGGTFLGIIGSIVCATAHSVNTMIGGMTIIGIASATQLSYYYVMGELVPMKYRFIGNAYVYMWQVPSSALAAAVSNAFILHTPVGWRGPFYIMIGVNTLSFLLWFLFYHPPTFHMKHEGETVGKYLRQFDYVGLVLYTGGLLIVMMGLNWGGSLYPWKSASVIATIAVGGVALVLFACWETYAALPEPLVNIQCFRNRAWNLCTATSAVAASTYYGLAIIWPGMVGLLWARADYPMFAPWLATFVSVFIIAGEIIGGIVAAPLRYLKWQCVASVLMGGVLLACVAAGGPNTMALCCVLVSLAVFCLGWVESLAISLITLSATDQDNLGTSGGLAGSIRFFVTCIASTIYSVVLRARQETTIPAAVIPAVEKAGLPPASVPAFLEAFTTGAFANVTGLTDHIRAVGTQAYYEGNYSAYRTVFLTTLAFTGCAFIATVLLPGDIDKLLTDRVHVTLHQGHDVEHLAGEKKKAPADVKSV